MSDTTFNTPIPMRRWFDLNILTGIEAGSAMSMQNLGTTDIWYSLGARPTEDNDRYRILTRGQILQIAAGESTVWVRSDVCTGEVNVQREEAATTPADSAFLLLQQIQQQSLTLELLTVRFEEAFPTGIFLEDLENGDLYRR